MGKFFRNMQVVCILVVLSVFLGCGSDNGVTVQDKPDNPNPPDPPILPVLGGTFGVYSTPNGESLNLYDTGGMVAVYVVHNVPEGATASTFMIDAPAGWTLVGAKSQFATIIGDVEDGISIAYGSCLTGSINLMALTYQTPGNATLGTEFEVMPHPYWPEHIQVVDCYNNIVDGARGLATPVELWLYESGSGGTDKKNPKPEGVR